MEKEKKTVPEQLGQIALGFAQVVEKIVEEKGTINVKNKRKRK